jgi:WD40 repeat protein
MKIATKEPVLINQEILLAALVTAWESEGYALGTGKYIQLNSLLKQLPAGTNSQQLKTLIAPIIAQNAQQQEEFYRLFDIVYPQVLDKNTSHKMLVKEEEKHLAFNDFKNKTTHFLTKNLPIRDAIGAKIALIIGALFILGLGVFGYFYFKKAYPDLKDSADVGEYKRFCFALNKGDKVFNCTQKTGAIQVFGIHEIDKSACIDYVPMRLGNDELMVSIKRNNGVTEQFKVFVSSSKIRNIVYASPNSRQGKMPFKMFKPLKNAQDSLNLFASANDSTQKEDVGGQYIEGISSNWELGFGSSYFTREKALIVLISALFVALLGFLWRYRRQKFTLKFTSDSSLPSSWTIRIPNLGNVLMDEKFYLAVSEMRKRDVNESKRIDVKKTINTSIQNGGMIEFSYLQATNSKNYLVLIDSGSEDNHREKLHEFIVKNLTNYDVPIDRFFFDGDVRFCWNEAFPRGISIADLRHKFSDCQLLIFSNGDALLHPDLDVLDTWTNVFDGWRKKLILTPRLPSDWGKNEDIIAQKFRLLPANTEGLAALVETLEAVDPKHHSLWKDGKNNAKNIDIAEDINAEELYARLEAEFLVYKNDLLDGRMIQWIAACALPPVPFWDWTLYVGELLNETGNPCLTLNNLFKISTLNWFIEGKIPNHHRSFLIKWLENNHPSFLISLIHEWSHILKLETNLPPVGSIAWQGHRIQVVLNDLLTQSTKQERRKLESELDNLLEGEAAKDALVIHYLDGRNSLLDNMLSDNFRRFIQTKRSIVWRWRDWTWQVPTVFAVWLLTLFIHYSEPVTSFDFKNNVTALHFLTDSKTFLVSNQEGKIGICDDNRWIQSVDSKNNVIDLSAASIGNESVVSAVNDKGDLMLWNQNKGTAEYVKITDVKSITSAAISNDLKQLIVGYYTTNNAQLWDVEKKTFISFLGHTDAIMDVAFSPDKQSVMTASRDNTARLWSINGGLLRTYIGHTSTVYSVDMSPDGTKILTSSRDNTAKLWDKETGSLIHTFKGHTYDVFDAHFSPDGQSIVTASGDKTAKLWSINGQLKRTFSGHYNYVKKALFSPDNKHVLTGDSDGKVKLWALSKD